MRLPSVLLITFVLAAAGQAFAQQGAVEAPDVPGVAPAARVIAGQDGLAIESGNGEYRLQIGLLVQADGRFAAAEESRAITDTFAFADSIEAFDFARAMPPTSVKVQIELPR